jgi:hypothetical protein
MAVVNKHTEPCKIFVAVTVKLQVIGVGKQRRERLGVAVAV